MRFVVTFEVQPFRLHLQMSGLSSVYNSIS